MGPQRDAPKISAEYHGSSPIERTKGATEGATAIDSSGNRGQNDTRDARNL